MKRKMVGLISGALAIAFLLSSVLLGCVPAPPTPPEEAAVYKIGVIQPLTGSGAGYGWGMIVRPGCEVFFDEVNAGGGVDILGKKHLIEFIILDDAYSPEKGRAAAERLIYRDGVDIIIGSTASPVTTVLLPLVEPNELILVCTSIVPDKLSKWVFRASPDWTATPIAALVTYLVDDRPDIETIVPLQPDDESGRSAAAGAIYACQEAGLEVMDPQYFMRGSSDYMPLLTRIKAQNPDLVYMCAVPPDDMALLVSQGSSIGAEWEWAATEAELDIMLEVCTNEEIEGLLAVGIVSTGPSALPEIAKYREEYEARYGEWNDHATIMQFLPRMIKKTLETTRSLEPEDLRYAMENVGRIAVFGGDAYWGGVVRAGIAHQLLLPMGVQVVRDGVFAQVGMASATELPPVVTLEELGF